MGKRVVTVKTVKQINGRNVLVNQEVEVSKDVYSAMMRPVWKEKKRVQRSYSDLNKLREKEENGTSNKMVSPPNQFKALGGRGEPMLQLRMGLPLSLDRICEETNFEATTQQNVEEAAEYHLLYEAFEEVLDDFSERNKMIMTHLLIDEMTEREVAEIVGCSQKTVNNTKKKLLPIIQEALKDWN